MCQSAHHQFPCRDSAKPASARIMLLRKNSLNPDWTVYKPLPTMNAFQRLTAPALRCVCLGLGCLGALGALGQNRVLELDGKESYVLLPSDIFNEQTEATVEGWVKWDRFGTWTR